MENIKKKEDEIIADNSIAQDKIKDQYSPQLIMNVQYTQYDVMKDVADLVNMQMSFNEVEDPDWDLYWLDGPIVPTFLFKMHAYQRVNHFPGMNILARKNLRARSLQAMPWIVSK